MELILLEAFAALAVLGAIVWWTMFAGRRGGERRVEPGALERLPETPSVCPSSAADAGAGLEAGAESAVAPTVAPGKAAPPPPG